MLTNCLAACTHISSTVSSYSNRKCKKSPFSRTAAHIFVSPRDVPATATQYVAWMERQFNACQTHRKIYLPIFNSFRVIRCLNQCVNPKIVIFTTFLFPLGTPLGQSRYILYGWKENSMLTNCLAACAHPTITISEIQRDICEKNRHFIIPPLHSTPPLGGSRRNIGTPFGMKKLEWCRYQM